MKKIRCLFFLAPLILAACQGTQENGKNNGQNENVNCIIKENTTINFLCMAAKDYHKDLVKMLDSFHEKEPHVTVNLYNPQGSGNYNMIEKYIIAGFFKEDYPDLAQCYPDNVVKYLAQGYAVNLDPYLENETYGLTNEENADYISSFINEGKGYAVKGTYSLPFCKSTELLYYNASLLLGIDLSSIDSSINEGKPLDEEYLNNLNWEDLFEKLCPALYTYNENLPLDQKLFNTNKKHAIFTYDSDENCFITLAKQYGYGYTSIDENGKGSIDFNNEGMKKIVSKLKNAKDKGYFHTKGSFGDYVSELFTTGQALFTISSTAGLAYNYNWDSPFRIGVAKIPTPKGNHEYLSINQGPSICVLNHDDENRKLASYLLWKHMTSSENSSNWSLATGYMAIRQSSYSTPEYIDKINFNDKEDIYQTYVSDNLKRTIEVQNNLFNTPVFRGSSNARTNVGLLTKEALNAEKLDEEIDDLFSHYQQDTLNYLQTK